MPSIVRVPEGYVEWAQKLKWRGLQLIKILSDRFSEQIFVENDVNLAAVGESGFGAGQGVDCMACVVVGAGTGAGIMFNGGLFRGHSHAAGELGWLLHDEALSGNVDLRARKTGELSESKSPGPLS